MLYEKLEEKKQPVTVNGVRQNCFRIGTSGGVTAVVKKPFAEQKTCEVLEKIALPNGYIETVVEKDYPINSASVSSLADGADYRNDPAQAIANAPQRVNLGDISEAQAFMENPQNNMRLFKEVAAKLNAYIDSQKAKSETKEEKVNG